MRYILIFSLLISSAVVATLPAESIELTNKNIKKLGFQVKAEKMRDWISVTLIAPQIIEQHWQQAATQSYPFTSENPPFLSKVGIEDKESETEVFISYLSKESDASVGVYYICTDKTGVKCSFGRERLYSIYSLNDFVE
ncbi:hypothetical protein SAMN02745866_03192 [Alteromonadaceae bacterium Bs31]|nr:hypothetical protein SAMN02745866_03192 [Alteromonadaceae bacterium Bs31]